MKLHRVGILLSIVFAIILRSLNFNYILSYPHMLCGYDPFYHMRRILVIMHGGNPWFDYYINYPYGAKVSWMPLFDYLIAYTSFGNPELIGSIYPVIFATLSVIVVYFIAKEFDSKLAVLSSLTLSTVFAYAWYSRLGFVDHHAAEVFLFSLTFLLLIKLFNTSKLEYSVALGFTIACLYLLWFGAPIYLGLILSFVLIAYLIYKDKTVLKYFLVSLSISLAILVIFLPVVPLFNHLLTILLVIFVVSLFVVNSNYIRIAMIAALVLLIFLNRDLILSAYNYFVVNEYIKTVSEAKPFKLNDVLQFWFVFPFAILGMILIIKNIKKHKDVFTLLVFLWGLFALLLTLVQSRFMYILSPAFSILSSYFVLSLRLKKRYILFLIVLLILPNVYNDVHFISKPPEIYGDWYDTLIWIGKNTPETSYYFENKKPEYGILSWWDYGNWIVYVSKRPVVANNFQTGIRDLSLFFTTTDEEKALKILKRRNARYIILDDRMGFDYLLNNGEFSGIAKGPGIFYDMLKFANRKKTDYYERIENTNLAKLKGKFYNSIYARMYLFYGTSTETPIGNVNALKHFRLIHESNTTAFKLGGVDVKKIRVYEYVKGAKVVGKAKPNEAVVVAARVKTKYSSFYYGYSVNADKNGRFELTLPYSTGKNYDVVVSNYMLRIGNKTFEFSL
ncbi:MAG: hypothetical protein J7K36_02865, partial [Archaeoglobaceae archaeon]|nr:hypothetical protein [Archaeoglobaceae archaeon]